MPTERPALLRPQVRQYNRRISARNEEEAEAMFTLKEKQYMLKLLKQEQRRAWFRLKKAPTEHERLVEKLEQMIRNEQVNREHL